MPRLLSPFFEQFFADREALNERVYNSHVGLEIALTTGAKIHVATGEFTMNTLSVRGVSMDIEPIFFEGKLLSAPEVQFSQGDTSDGSTGCKIGNLDYILTGVMVEENRILEGAKITVFVCLKKSDGTYEGLTYGKGNLRVTQGDDEQADLDYVSDMSDRSVTAAGREITQKCLNVLGEVSHRSFCPAPDLPDGAECTLELDDEAGGCAFWAQQAFFKGVSFFNPNSIPNYSGPTQNIGSGDSNIINSGGWQEPVVEDNRYLGLEVWAQ